MTEQSEAERAILESVRKMALREVPQYLDDGSRNILPRPLFEQFAALGLTGLSIAEQFGGLAQSPAIVSQVMEEIAAVDLGPAVFLSVHLMVAGLIERFGSDTQKQMFLEPLASGRMLGAFALTEPSAGSDAASLRTTYELRGDTFILNGEKCYITSAGFADLYIVFARRSGSEGAQGISAFIVPASAPGLSISPPERKMGCALSPIASLTFKDTIVPSSQLLGVAEQGYRVALSGLAGGRVNIAACANGVSRNAIARATEFLKERRQFGRPLSEFQGLQFMLADMQMSLAAAQLLTQHAAQLLGAPDASEDQRLYPSMAKCFATDAAMRITTDAVQLLGGAGYIREYRVEQLMRDAKMLQIVEGTNQIQRTLIARAMLKE